MDPRLAAVARAAKGFMPEDEGLALYRAALAAPAGPLLEIGTYCAKSAVYLGAAAEARGATLWSVDHHRGSEENQAGWEHHDTDVVDPESGRMDTLPWARRTLAAAGLEGRVVLVVGSSEVVAAGWAMPLALLFIDGGHGDATAWADYRSWAPKVALGGFLAIHDVFPDPADGGRPPYELYLAAQREGQFREEARLGLGSLRVLRRVSATRPGANGPGPRATAGCD